MNRVYLDRAAAFCIGAIAALAFSLTLLAGHAEDDAKAIEQARQSGISSAQSAFGRSVPDRPISQGTYMPLYLQTDSQWSHVPYADGTVGDSGCGLVCAAMAVKYLTTQDVTPLQLAGTLGDSCLTDGVNDPGKFCEWMARAYPEYGIEFGAISYDLESALSRVSDGWLAFAGMGGALGDNTSDGHVVLIWRADDAGYWLRDPASPGNSARQFTTEELAAVDFRYFYTIRGGFYGNAGN